MNDKFIQVMLIIIGVVGATGLYIVLYLIAEYLRAI